ncbi:DUF998 domain-containing protein [Actinokineospora auranticolor]|uniref:Uncharacterized protein DUF998 n=1 Tax=Actinokineospora auranticolor TaxID=155976 RepID=A0A2S6GTN3_9PSEU|nr:DUF998 domain-containing protein [Actinokineospora auranticolor]PPK68570.1 uncharacterized protein DUF998 [Actinokineospora auranticolor]
MTTTVAPTTNTRALLTCAAVAAPLWAVVALAQAATRDGFDLTRHPLSLLATGDLGWSQVLNFVVAGLLTTLGASGLARTLPSTWAPRLIRVNGIAMVAAGLLTMDPADGFPSGTPAGTGELSWHAYGHLAAGTTAFGTLIAACYVLARAFARTGRRGHATRSRIAGTALLLGDLWAMAGGTAGSLTLAVGAITAMLWVSYVAVELR